MRTRPVGLAFASLPTVLSAALLGVLPVAAAVSAVATVAAVAAPAAVPSAHADLGTSAYVALPAPTRLLDSRTTFGALGPGGVATVNVTGAAPLPAPGATVAAVLNITVVGPAGEGYWTAYAHGTTRPLAASLYVDRTASALDAGLALANLVTVPVSADGQVDIYTLSGGALVVDMLGSYQTSGATDAGRFLPLPSPTRIAPTGGADPGLQAADSAVTVTVPNGAGAQAAVVTITTIAAGPGFWTLYPTGVARPLAANLNSTGPFAITANQAIVSLSAAGTFDVYSQSGGLVYVDLVGLISGAGGPATTDGLFVPLASPTRFLDTRDATLNPLGKAEPLQPAWGVEVPVGTNPAINRSDVEAVTMNVTVTDPLKNGYVTVSPAGTDDPSATTRATATVSIQAPGQILASHSTVAVSGRGFDAFSQIGSHVVADVTGFYVGTPVAATFGKPATTNAVAAGCVGFPGTAVSPITVGTPGPVVAVAQQRLLDLGFWLSGPTGRYDLTTSQAVMAFQKWTGLPRTTQVDAATAAALNTVLCRPTPSLKGDLIEVDKGKQLLFIVRASKAVWVVNTSTGGNYFYTATDQKTGAQISDTAITPDGTFHVYRVADDPAYKGSLGTLYRPRFFSGGVAVHGYSSVPNFPASHGCVRVTNAAMDMLWGGNFMPMGGTVVVHE